MIKVATTLSKTGSSASSLSVRASSNYYGADVFDFYLDNVYQTTVTGTDDGTGYYYADYTFSGLSEYTSYAIGVHVFLTGTDVEQGSASYYTDDITDPTVTITGSSSTASSVTLSASGSDSGSGVSGFYFYLNGSFITTVYGSSASYTFTGLAASTTYTAGVQSFDVALNSSTTASTNITTLSARPANYSWSTAKTAGATFSLTAAEWNGFTSRINDFRTYKSLAAYGFTSAVAGNNFTAAVFNEAVSAINAMSPPTSPPSAKSAGNDVFASYLNDLVTSLNSIP